MPLSVNTHESAALYQSMAANLRKAHGTMREVLEAPDRAATLPGEAPDRAATLPTTEALDEGHVRLVARQGERVAGLPAAQGLAAARAHAAATPTTVTSFGEEGADATPDPAPAKAPVVAKPSPAAKARGRREAGEAGGAAQTTAAAGRGRGPRQEEGASPKKATSKAAPAPTVYRSGWSESQAATRTAPLGRHAGARLRRLALRGRPAALPAQARRRDGGGAPARRQVQVAAVAARALTTEGRAWTPGFDETAPTRRREFKARKARGRRAGGRRLRGRAGGGARARAAAPREGPAACGEGRARDARG